MKSPRLQISIKLIADTCNLEYALKSVNQTLLQNYISVHILRYSVSNIYPQLMCEIIYNRWNDSENLV